jgi:hypothetical protein
VLGGTPRLQNEDLLQVRGLVAPRRAVCGSGELLGHGVPEEGHLMRVAVPVSEGLTDYLHLRRGQLGEKDARSEREGGIVYFNFVSQQHER